MSAILLVSGFLGSGKTSFILKVLKRYSAPAVIIENDFGKISLDTMLLADAAVQVTSITEGCVCCSVSGDFRTGLEAIIKAYPEHLIMIEPSGVAKLSEMVQLCYSLDSEAIILNMTAVCMLDISKFEVYLDNFSSFYRDQIANADYVISTFGEKVTDQNSCKEQIHAINPRAEIIDFDEASIERFRFDRPDQPIIGVFSSSRSYPWRAGFNHIHFLNRPVDAVDPDPFSSDGAGE